MTKGADAFEYQLAFNRLTLVAVAAGLGFEVRSPNQSAGEPAKVVRQTRNPVREFIAKALVQGEIRVLISTFETNGELLVQRSVRAATEES